VLASDGAADLQGLRYPVVVKPLSRRDLAAVAVHGKAVIVQDEAAMQSLWPSVAAAGVELLVQELVPGPESRIESWHAYVDDSAAVVGQFCGVKIRTWPLICGHSTALRVTDVEDVRQLGCEVVRRLGVRGLVKVDFKRDPEGALQLLEVNPRASLWLHPGAVAGVNLAALQYADLTGGTRPAVRLSPGVTWMAPGDDCRAARADGVPAAAWLGELLRCQARSGAAWDDPGPLLRGQLVPALARAARRTLRRRSGRRTAS
jgi:predicted ATP-grasp superfamily ATP-dependent carboligase